MTITKSRGAIFCLTISLAILLVELLLPLSWDNWVYQTMGWDLYAYGKLPYLGSWDVNFPGIVYLHALSIALMGTSDLAFRNFDVIFETATCLFFYKLLIRWFRPFFALIASIVYPLLYVSLAWRVAGQRDAFAVFFLFAGLVVLFNALNKSTSRIAVGRLIAAGFLVASAAIIRPTYGLFSLSVIIAYFLSERRFDRKIGSFILGTMCAFAALFLPYLLSYHGLQDFYRFTIQFNIDVYSKYVQPSIMFIFSLQETGRVATAYVIAGVITIVVMRLLKSTPSLQKVPQFVLYLYGLLLASSIASIFVMRTYQADHFLPLLAMLSPIMACAIYSPLLLKWRLLRIPLMVCIMLYLTYRLYPRNLIHHYRTGLASGVPALEYVYNIVDPDSLAGPTAEERAVNYLKTADPTQKPIEVVCYNRPYLYVPARLESITRFTEILPLSMRTRDGDFTSYQIEWRREFMEELTMKQPMFIVFTDNLNRPFGLQSPFELAQQIHGFSTLIAGSYHLDTVIRGFTFYRRDKQP
jgi:Dolichyl-phosphate-mannose-protein mannosyltransferase